MTTETLTLVARLERSLLERAGETSRAQREEATRAEGNGPLGQYLQQIEQAAYKVTTEQVDALRTSHSDDALFELTVCAAHGAAKRRLDVGLRAIDEAFGDER
ncbi:MAG: hypothetical protein Q8S33_12805 [Myxococcales bacterium]|nr:hypothetical protein [Myxococcales bacterium]MDP3501216.1 hypothetical protein [Myxococcales bacterium]